MIDITKFSELVGAIYDANVDATKWATLAHRVASVFSSESGSLQVRDLVPGGAASFLSITENVTDWAKSSYERYYFERDVYVQHAVKYGLNAAYLSHEAVSTSDVAKSEFYTDWGKRIGIFHVVGGGTMFGPSSVALLALHRPMGAAMFDEAEREFLGLLLPHLGRALQIAAQMGGLRASDQARSDALERLNVGAVVVAADCAILWSNAVAEKLFREGDAIQSVCGRLKARRHQDVLHRMICDCASPMSSVKVPGGLLTVPRPGRAALSLLTGPLDAASPGIGLSRPAAIVFAHDPEMTERSHEAALMTLYKLTAAEARLAAALAGGERLQGYAERQSISLATVKTQLRQVLGKTDTERQTDLVAKLTRNSVLRMAAALA